MNYVHAYDSRRDRLGNVRAAKRHYRVTPDSECDCDCDCAGSPIAADLPCGEIETDPGGWGWLYVNSQGELVAFPHSRSER